MILEALFLIYTSICYYYFTLFYCISLIYYIYFIYSHFTYVVFYGPCIINKIIIIIIIIPYV